MIRITDSTTQEEAGCAFVEAVDYLRAQKMQPMAEACLQQMIEAHRHIVEHRMAAMERRMEALEKRMEVCEVVASHAARPR